MGEAPLDRAQSYRKRARILRTLADGMAQSGGNGDLLRRVAVEYDRMAATLDTSANGDGAPPLDRLPAAS
jgi:hypothetical protein